MCKETENKNKNAVAAIVEGNDFMLGLNELKTRANMVSKIKAEIMRNGTHFGVIPGCGDKPTLLKNGAELLCMAFKLAPDAKVEIADLGNGHREYTVTTTLTIITTGVPVATGLGSCSTMESKYRYRNVADYELTGQDIPKDYKNKKNEYRKQGFGAKKVNGEWVWVRFKDSAKAENPDIADTYNTVLKMASKRSLVDAVLKATGGSCEFTQDIEDMGFGGMEYPEYTVMDEQPISKMQKAPEQTQDERDANWLAMCEELRNKAPEAFDAYIASHNVPELSEIRDRKQRHELFAELTATVNAAAQEAV